MNTILKKCFCFFIGLCFLGQSTLIWAEEEVIRFDLKKSITWALKNSESYRIKDLLMDKAKAVKDSGVALIRPQISAQASWANHLEYPTSLRPSQQDFGTSIGLEISQIVFAFGRLTSSIKAAEEYMVVTLLEKEVAKQDLIALVKTLFYGCLAAQETKKVLQQSLKHTQDNKEALEESFALGRPSKADLLKISADIAGRIPSVKSAETYEEQQMIYLKILLGLPSNASIELIGDLFAPIGSVDEPHDIGELLTQRNPSLKALNKNIELQKHLVTMKKAQYYPQIDAFLSYQNAGRSDDAYMKQGRFDDHATVGLKVKVPFWNGGLTAAELKQARLDYDIAKLNLDHTQKELISALESAFEQYDAYQDIVASQKTAVQLAQESYQMVKGLFQTGQGSVSQLNDAELFWTSQRMTLIQTLYECRQVEAKIEQMIPSGEGAR